MMNVDDINKPQPDAVLRVIEVSGGQSLLGDDDYLEGGPELVVEVAASSATYDLRERSSLLNPVRVIESGESRILISAPESNPKI